ncbi:unnamed protein product [Litomosoides sigmodontis]|uniref:Uncharacterized protein n=1 Tax=Litomosoides sigmodontis TaxID=42156 RepID=A0A3P6TRU6_LITSI|nr:unnamed protein product [Litomosoides sigmodontis]
MYRFSARADIVYVLHRRYMSFGEQLSIAFISDELILLLPTLIAVDGVEEARALQTQFLTLTKLTHKVIGTAWPTYLSRYIIPGPLREIYRDENGVIKLPEGDSMPDRIPFESELMRPQIRNVLWQLEICS